MSTSTIQAITYETAFAVTQSDTVTDTNGPFAALQCTAVGGTAKVHTKTGQDVTIYLAIGQIVPLAVTRVWSTGTTSGLNLIGLRALPYTGPTGT
jgi:hypothetical protein